MSDDKPPKPEAPKPISEMTDEEIAAEVREVLRPEMEQVEAQLVGDPDLELPKLEVAVLEDPEMFEIGFGHNLGDAPMIVFIKDGKPSHALAFTGLAGEKLLLSFGAMLGLLYGSAVGEEESPQFVVPDKKKKNPTLH